MVLMAQDVARVSLATSLYAPCNAAILDAAVPTEYSCAHELRFMTATSCANCNYKAECGCGTFANSMSAVRNLNTSAS